MQFDKRAVFLPRVPTVIFDIIFILLTNGRSLVPFCLILNNPLMQLLLLVLTVKHLIILCEDYSYFTDLVMQIMFEIVDDTRYALSFQEFLLSLIFLYIIPQGYHLLIRFSLLLSCLCRSVTVSS